MASLNTYEVEPNPVKAVLREPARYPARAHARRVRLARNGDREAFDALVETHRESLRSFLRSRIESVEVDDVIQDVLVAAWRAMPSYDGRSQFRTWLFAIAYNKVRDHFRARMRRVTEVQSPLGETVRDEGRDPFADTDLSVTVHEMLKSLSDSQREVVLLYYQDRLTLAEIGSVLGRNLSTVKYQFFQAHSKLADQMSRSPDWSAFRPRKEEAR